MKGKMKNRKMLVASSVLAVALMVGSSVTAFAASSDTTTATYGYLTGQSKNSDRHAVFETAAGFTSDEERKAYFEVQGIGSDGEYSTEQNLNAEVLVTAGVIDQATADSIQAYASSKHDEIHSRYGNTSEMTPDERHAMYESFESDGFDGDTASELLNVGVITQEQADAINAYLE